VSSLSLSLSQGFQRLCIYPPSRSTLLTQRRDHDSLSSTRIEKTCHPPWPARPRAPRCHLCSRHELSPATIPSYAWVLPPFLSSSSASLSLRWSWHPLAPSFPAGSPSPTPPTLPLRPDRRLLRDHLPFEIVHPVLSPGSFGFFGSLFHVPVDFLPI
jgi:hypothetical protein